MHRSTSMTTVTMEAATAMKRLGALATTNTTMVTPNTKIMTVTVTL